MKGDNEMEGTDDYIYYFQDLLTFIAKNGTYTTENKSYFLGVLKGIENNLTKEENNIIKELLK